MPLLPLLRNLAAVSPDWFHKTSLASLNDESSPCVREIQNLTEAKTLWQQFDFKKLRQRRAEQKQSHGKMCYVQVKHCGNVTHF